jgi:signal transduction histidine kinase
MANELTKRLALVGSSCTLTVFSCLGLGLFIVTVTSMGLVLVSVGIPLLAACFPLLRRHADLHRRWAARQLGIARIPSPYGPPPAGNLLGRLWLTARAPSTRRDLVWLLVNSTAGLALYIIALVEALLGLVFWWMPRPKALDVNARIARAMLAPDEKAQLAARVQQLAESRAETVDTQATEIRRIERDLHDGAQARLVALGMNLGMAADSVEKDPQSAKLLLAEAQAASSQALAELRALVRGIHPPVLADRGLAGAVQALVLVNPLPIDVEADVPRLPAPVESAAYFAVAEALTNVVKHSGAHRARVSVLHTDGRLLMTVEDDGRGGAVPSAGGGLLGIERRLAAFDGTLMVTSPPGGPTHVIMELPCESSSPKTSPSSGTA